MRTFIFSLTLIVSGVSPAFAQHDPEKHHLPQAGESQHQIEDQIIARNLGDRIDRLARTETDSPYEVVDGGMPLPTGLCEKHPAGCRGTGDAK